MATVRLILQYYDRNRDALQVRSKPKTIRIPLCLTPLIVHRSCAWQLSDAYLSTMASVLFQKHLSADHSLFPDVAPLLVTAAPADIQALPWLQDSTTV